MAVKDRQGMTYAYREDVKRALDIAETARADDQIDRALASASDSVESLLNRRFYPEIRPQAFDWPAPLGTTSLPFTVYFDLHDVLSITTLTSRSQIVPRAHFLLPAAVPPFPRIALDAAASAPFVHNNPGQRPQ